MSGNILTNLNAPTRPLPVDVAGAAALSMGKIAGIVFGAATQLLFLWTVYKLFLFLRFGSSSIVPFFFGR